jgi:site-specific recombinase XerC
VPLSDSLVKVLARHIEVHGVGEHGTLFPGPSGALWKRAAAGRRFASIVKRAGLDSSISWHNLRDTAAATMLHTDRQLVRYRTDTISAWP